MKFIEGEYDGKHIVVFEIQPATHQPIAFNGLEYIRVSSYSKKLKDFPEKERAQWALFADVTFEKGIAAENVSGDEVLALIDYPKYFRLMKQTLPANREAILEKFVSEKVIQGKPSSRYNITNVGAIP